MHQDVETWEVETSSGTVTSTAEHPFWVDGRGWTPVRELQAGDNLVDTEGVRVELVSVTPTGTTAIVYNFHVDELHSYHVQTGGVWLLVHNMCDTDEVKLVYESNPKHGPVSYRTPRGEVSRAPRGDTQAMLEESTLVKPQLRHGVEPETGLQVVFRRHREFEGTEWWHGFVPGG